MLQQTVIKAVIPVYDKFFSLFPSVHSLASATSEDVRLAVRGLGYYRRFDLLHKGAIEISKNRKGQWPKSFQEWLTIPGVGSYTASALSSITLNEHQGVVDGNVERVLCRIHDIRTAPNLPALKQQFKQTMDQLVSHGNPGSINQAIMEIGQTICTPTQPSCDVCPLNKHCLSKKNKSQSISPGPKVKTVFQEIDLAIVIPRLANGRFLLVKRSEKARFLKSTVGFPTFIKVGNEWQGDGFQAPPWLVQRIHASSIRQQKRSKENTGKTFKHSITKYKILAQSVLSTISVDEARQLDGTGFFLDANDVEAKLVSNLDRKAMKSIRLL
ncbi:MAG: hypothetical protein NT027_11730 [Proteobacteria bacterium]|nr:hypothetical protein [Pseudomonadota bacterium]